MRANFSLPPGRRTRLSCLLLMQQASSSSIHTGCRHGVHPCIATMAAWVYSSCKRWPSRQRAV